MPRPPSLHIRTRIALWIATISIGLLVLMASAVFATFDRQLKSNLDDTLSLRSDTNRQLVDLTSVPPSLVRSPDPEHERFQGEAVLRLYAGDGSLLSDSSPAAGTTAEVQALVQAAAARRSDLYRTIDLGGDEDYRVIASPIRVSDTSTVVLITGLEQERVTGPLRILRLILLIAVPVTAAAAGLGGYWIARRALLPVAAMTETARRISRGDLHQRVPGATANDELGRLAATLNAMIARLGETVERERRFTADASHELRTPLAAIETGIDVTLAHERSAAEYRRVLTVVRGQATRLNTLANRLLLLSRLDADELRSTFTTVELSGLLEAVVDSFRDGHPEATLQLFNSPEPLEVRGDLQLLARAAVNLLENAVIHGGARVGVTIRLTASGDRALLVIEDDGPGIPPDLAAGIFQRFRRGDAARSRGGAGLGLAIVEAIVLCHRGSVRLVTSPGARGARFEILLPLSTAASP
jgi:signal transduction histidine kinase